MGIKRFLMIDSRQASRTLGISLHPFLFPKFAVLAVYFVLWENLAVCQDREVFAQY
jgi:hypothetical protein